MSNPWNSSNSSRTNSPANVNKPSRPDKASIKMSAKKHQAKPSLTETLDSITVSTGTKAEPPSPRHTTTPTNPAPAAKHGATPATAISLDSDDELPPVQTKPPAKSLIKISAKKKNHGPRQFKDNIPDTRSPLLPASAKAAGPPKEPIVDASRTASESRLLKKRPRPDDFKGSSPQPKRLSTTFGQGITQERSQQPSPEYDTDEILYEGSPLKARGQSATKPSNHRPEPLRDSQANKQKQTVDQGQQAKELFQKAKRATENERSMQQPSKDLVALLDKTRAEGKDKDLKISTLSEEVSQLRLTCNTAQQEKLAASEARDKAISEKNNILAKWDLYKKEQLQQVENLKADLVAGDEKWMKAKKEKSELQHALDSSKSTVDELRSQLEEMQSLREKFVKLELDLKEANKTVGTQSAKVLAFDAAFKSKEAAHDTAIQQLTERHKALSKDYEDEKKSSEELRTQVIGVEEARRRLEAEAKKLKKDITSLQVKYDQATVELDTCRPLATQWNEFVETTTELCREADLPYVSDKGPVFNTILVWTNKLNAETKLRMQKERRLELLKGEKDQLEKSNAQLSGDLSKESNLRQEQDRLNGQLTADKEKLEQSVNLLQDENKRLQELNTALSEGLDKEAKMRQEDGQEQDRQNQELRGEKKQLEQSVAMISGTLTDERRLRQGLDHQNSQLRADNKRLEQSVNELSVRHAHPSPDQEQVNLLRSQIAALEPENRALQSENGELKSENGVLKSEVARAFGFLEEEEKHSAKFEERYYTLMEGNDMIKVPEHERARRELLRKTYGHYCPTPEEVARVQQSQDVAQPATARDEAPQPGVPSGLAPVPMMLPEDAFAPMSLEQMTGAAQASLQEHSPQIPMQPSQLVSPWQIQPHQAQPDQMAPPQHSTLMPPPPLPVSPRTQSPQVQAPQTASRQKPGRKPRQKPGQMPAPPPAIQPKRATPGQLKKSAQARTSSH